MPTATLSNCNHFMAWTDLKYIAPFQTHLLAIATLVLFILFIALVRRYRLEPARSHRRLEQNQLRAFLIFIPLLLMISGGLYLNQLLGTHAEGWMVDGICKLIQ